MLAVGGFDTKVLQSMWHYCGGSPNFSAFDDDLLRAGRQLFGPAWGGEVRNYKGEPEAMYCPTIALSLGRLASLGLVRKLKSFGRMGISYHSWNLTAQGFNWCQEAFGEISKKG